MPAAGRDCGKAGEDTLGRISVGILTWRRPSTLRYALRSYRRAGLLDAWGEVILFANGADPREVAVAERFGLRLLSSPDNIGIGPAFARLAEAAARPNFLFLENDWPCIEPADIALRRMACGVGLLDSGDARAVRYRHRRKYGHPLYSRARCEGRELDAENLAHILDAVHWRTDPDTQFPHQIERRTICGEDWFFAAASHAAYTNNPCLYRTEFARDQIARRSLRPGVESEAALQAWWQAQDLTVAMGPGLFTHRDPGKEWRRAGRILKGLLSRRGAE